MSFRFVPAVRQLGLVGMYLVVTAAGRRRRRKMNLNYEC